MEGMRYVVEVEKAREATQGKPSMGPVYRGKYPNDSTTPPIDVLNSCWDIFRSAYEKYPTNTMLGTREIENAKAGRYKWQTYKEVYEVIQKVGSSIRSCGYGQVMKCGIYGANCPGWIISMEACNAHGLYCVPLYDTLGAGAVEFIICHAEISIAFVEEKKISELLKTFPNASKFLKTLVSFGKFTPVQKQQVENLGVKSYSWDEFLQVGENQNFDLPVIKKSDICTIMYTSGTTGDPKGVLLSNESVLTAVSAILQFLSSCKHSLRNKEVYISYLPLAHIFDRVIEEAMIYVGASIGFWRGDARLLLEDVAELRPTIFCAVPRVLDRVYTGLQNKISAGGFVKQTMFNFAYSYKLNNLMNGVGVEDAAPLFDSLVFSKIKQSLGGRVRILLSGGAPLAKHVELFLRVVTCSLVIQGYGLTETGAASFAQLLNNFDMLGTVGVPLPYVDACLESVPDMGYDALASTPRGEVCIRGGTLCSGYHKREDLTNEAIIDGWFHTGDIGEWQPNGNLKIIENIFKLSQGEYVAVEHLENVYGQSSVLESIWVYGSSFEAYLVAVINPKKDALERWAEENNITKDYNSLCEDPKAKAYVLAELVNTAKAKKLKGFEFIKAIHLDPVPFDQDRDLITPTFKKKRPQMHKYYKNNIDEMYKSINNKTSA
ncbi:long chain acyl-CoA synthetase 5-like isoform X2 [Arachis ipaensis]|uniref:long chain acyl-CoA synthetase 5-like isoform X2 n=3 Tax=Arachis ipaensis TaxID=130454 RepID=UPI000A2B09ED|nr:long chain acyl-CoA synthetase 5-like isoform X2 [Arachis ipaensis]